MIGIADTMDIRCKGCGRVPEDIEEYVELADDYKSTPTQVVIENEGTYNPSTGKFYCTTCYIKAGMPLGKAY